MIEVKKNNQSGFTLLEVLIALFIFAVGILGVNALQLTSVRGNGKSNRITTASDIAADQIETFLSLNYDDPALDDDDGTGDGTGQDTNNDGIDDNGGNFGLDDITVATADGNSSSGNYQIFWNVAIDHPIPNTKTIKVFVISPGEGANVEMQVVKARPF